MLVGCKDIDFEELKSAALNKQSLEHYAVSLVPRCLRHINAIVDNQKYLVALYLRDMKSIPYVTRKLRCEELLKGTSVTGVINTITDFDDILMKVDMDTLVEYLFSDAVEEKNDY